MTFANPQYFLLLIPTVLFLLLFFRNLIGKEAAVHFSNIDLVRKAGARNISLRRICSGLFRALALVFLIIALARPQTGHGNTEETRELIDVMIAVDVSSSMATLDFHPDNRLAAAKVEAERFIRNRPDDRLGLVTFAKNSFTVSPLTTDHAALLQLLRQIRMGVIEDGTAIGVGLANALNRLRESDAKSKVAILLTDGVNNAGEIDPLTAGDIAKELGIRVYTIGMGKDGVAMVPIQDPRFGTRMAQAYTEIDVETLKKIAEGTGGLFFRADDEIALRRIFDEIDKLEKTKVKVHNYTIFDEHYPIFLQIACAILILELLVTQLLWRKLP